ncbi:hypothetical protein M0R72_14155 [Candidatus Pacearchaeota archaeon]|jgi:hypothetical protein|nr:hypothetical protein [Candidatus Pacearchaeota archaeon]
MKVKDLKPAGYNPRKISKEKLSALKKSLGEFGDLSGIVFNTRTKTLIGGHQRTRNLDPSWPIIKEPQTDKTGTTATGYVETPYGRLTYREVDWPDSKEKQANIAANKHGGEFDEILLKDLLEEIKLEDPALDIELMGFDEKELAKFDKYNELYFGSESTESAAKKNKQSCPKCGFVWGI